MTVCPETRWTQAYHDGELDAPQARQFEEHLRVCPACQLELRNLGRLSELLGSVSQPEMPSGTMERLHHNLDTMRDRSLRRVLGCLTAAAAAVLVACSLWLWQLPDQQNVPAGMPDWERDVATLQAEQTGADPQIVLAQWVVDNMTRTDANDEDK